MQDKPKYKIPDQGAVLVTGGSGFIGRRLVKRFADDGQTVVCMYHHRLPEPMANVYPVCSDMGSSELIAAPLRGVHTVVHLAWEGNFVGPAEKVSGNLNSKDAPKNIKLLKNLIGAMEKAGTRRLVFISAIGASRQATSPFLQEKYLAELNILNSSIPEKIILRSTVACGGEGSNDKFIRSIVRVMQFPGVYPVPKQKENLSPLHVDDLVDVLANAAADELVHKNGILEVRGKESYGIDELFKLVSERYVTGSKIALRGLLGTSLMPLFERDTKQDPNGAKLKHFLSVGNNLDDTIERENPLKDLLPAKYHSFKDVLSKSVTP